MRCAIGMKIKQVWYSNNVDVRSPDTIHQVLVFGGLEDIKDLLSIVGETKVKELFLQHPKKVYTPAALNFIKNFIFGITVPIDGKKYLKFTPRSTRG